MTQPLFRFLLPLACALCAACEPTYPQTDDATADSAAGTDAAIVADTRTDAVADSAVDTQPLTDTTGTDALADTHPDVPGDVPDIQTDAPLDTPDGFVPMPVSATNIDVVGLSWACTDTAWQPGTCAPGVLLNPPLLPGIHVDLPYPITYTDVPPSSGTHRPVWGKWGEYVFLPEQRWLHNLEHGAIAFLYNPCVPSATVDALRAIAKAQPVDGTGPFRWVLTPYPGLPSAFALLSWGHIYEAECVKSDEIAAFILAHYRQAPDDEPTPGAYEELWLNNWP